MRLAAILGLIDGAGQEASRRIDAPVIESAPALVFRVVRELLRASAVGIEQPQAGAEACDEAAALPEPDASDLLGHGKGPMHAVRGLKAVERLALDIDEVERLLLDGPDGALSQFGPNIQCNHQAHDNASTPNRTFAVKCSPGLRTLRP
jgi:hypothetical protein